MCEIRGSSQTKTFIVYFLLFLKSLPKKKSCLNVNDRKIDVVSIMISFENLHESSTRGSLKLHQMLDFWWDGAHIGVKNLREYLFEFSCSPPNFTRFHSCLFARSSIDSIWWYFYQTFQTNFSWHQVSKSTTKLSQMKIVQTFL